MDDENEILIEEKEASRAMHAYTLPCAYKFLQFLQVVITNYSSYATSYATSSYEVFHKEY